MVISIALFGFGASGTFLSIVDIRKKAWLKPLTSRIWLAILLYLYAFSAIFSFLALNHLPLDYFRLPVEPIQILYLLAAYLLPALPFFFSGMIISIAYITVPEKTGLVYFASMSGSALGAALPIPLLPLLGEGKLIILSASISLIPVIFSTFYPYFKNTNSLADQRQWRILGAAGIITSVFLCLNYTGRNRGQFNSRKTVPLQSPFSNPAISQNAYRRDNDHYQGPNRPYQDPLHPLCTRFES